MSSGGKGGRSSSAQEIPKWMEEPAIRNIARAEDIQRMGYMPWYGPDVAAFNPTQQVAAQANIGAAEAFGLSQPGQLTAYQGMPQAQTFAGGVQGYSSAPIFEQGIDTLRQKQPGTMAQYDALFGAGTQPGGGGTITGPSFTEQVNSGNFSSYSDYNPSTGLYDNQISDGGDISSYVMDDGSINWGATGNADYGTVDGVGVTNPDGAYGYGGDSGGGMSNGGDLSGSVGSDGGIDWNSVGNPDYGMVDGVGVTNPDGAYGYGGDSGSDITYGGVDPSNNYSDGTYNDPDMGSVGYNDYGDGYYSFDDNGIEVGYEAPPSDSGGSSNDSGCFIDSTLVTDAEGKDKAIVDFKIGDKVMSADGKSVNTVKYIEKVSWDDSFVIYSPDSKHKPFITQNHPIIVNDEWVSADLDYTQRNQPWIDAKEIESPVVKRGKGITVYNLWVDGDNTYTVNGYGTETLLGDGGVARQALEFGNMDMEDFKAIVNSSKDASAETSYGMHLLNKWLSVINNKTYNKFIIDSVLGKRKGTLVKSAISLVGNVAVTLTPRLWNNQEVMIKEKV